MRKMLFAGICTLGFVLSSTLPASAISAWSRRYGADCSMCHTPVLNRLNGTGKEFMKRGHRLPGEGSEVDGKAISIDHYWSIMNRIRYEDREGENSKFDVEALSLYIGGPLSGNFSFFAEQYLHESNGAGSDREKLADAYGQFNFGKGDDYTAVRAGQILPVIIHTHGSGARLGISRPAVMNDYTARVGTDAVGGALFNTYRPRQRQYGIDLSHNFSKAKVYGQIGIVNGNGHAPPNVNYDPTNGKDFYFTVEKTFDDHGSSLGLYGYRGEAVPSTGAGVAPVAKGGPQLGFTRLGVMGNYSQDKWALIGGYVRGSDDTLIGGAAGPKVKGDGFFLEGNYFFNKSIAALARYDSVQPDSDALFAVNRKVKGPTIGIMGRPSQHTRVGAELRSIKTGAANSIQTLTAELQWMY